MMANNNSLPPLSERRDNRQVMITRRSALIALPAPLLVSPIWGADFWTKNPSECSEKDIDKMLLDSPWAKSVTATFNMEGMGGGRGGRGGGMGGGMPGGGGMGGPGGGGMGGPGGGMGGGGPMGGGPGGGGGMPSITAQIRWASSKPIKIATLKKRFGNEWNTAEEAKKTLANKEEFYVIAASGLPSPGSRGMGGGLGGGMPEGMPEGAPQRQGNRQAPDPAEMAERMKDNTSLEQKGKAPRRPSEVQMAQGTILFAFSREIPITLEDKEVEFVTKMGPLEFKRKFRLKDMMYEGELSL
jgi:hypothetical protein